MSIKFALHGTSGEEESLRIAGGPGSGWTAEGRHVAGSKAAKSAISQHATAKPDTVLP